MSAATGSSTGALGTVVKPAPSRERALREVPMRRVGRVPGSERRLPMGVEPRRAETDVDSSLGAVPLAAVPGAVAVLAAMPHRSQ
jgi:hypothetical protein